LAALARTESDFQPLSINDNTTGTSGVPANRDVAIRIASPLLAAGHSVDIGLMQINSRNFGSLGLTLDAAFDPCRSIAAAAAILVGDYAGGISHDAQQAALRVALSRYNTGDGQRGFANGYVHKVELAARRIVPALDVGGPVAATDEQHAPAAAAATPSDPNAPPAWDVWTSYDYAAAHRPDASSPADTLWTTKPAVLADAGQGPPAAAPTPGPTAER
jgi:type IV secretion system protein VirB1